MSDAETIKQCRTDLELTQGQLAAELGISVRTIKRYESGDKVPTRVMLALQTLKPKKGTS